MTSRNNQEHVLKEYQGRRAKLSNIKSLQYVEQSGINADQQEKDLKSELII